MGSARVGSSRGSRQSEPGLLITGWLELADSISSARRDILCWIMRRSCRNHPVVICGLPPRTSGRSRPPKPRLAKEAIRNNLPELEEPDRGNGPRLAFHPGRLRACHRQGDRRVDGCPRALSIGTGAYGLIRGRLNQQRSHRRTFRGMRCRERPHQDPPLRA
jgi:hypothetical protein